MPTLVPTPTRLAVLGVLWLTACPAPSDPFSTGQARKQGPSGEPGSSVATPAELAAPAEPAAPAELADPALPASLANAPALARTVWSTLEAIDDGDAEAMSQVMAPTARWFPPGSIEESVSNDSGQLARALAVWTSPDVSIDVRHLVVTGGPLVAQIAVVDADTPEYGYEIVLLFEERGDQIAMVRQYGDPLGPVRMSAEDLAGRSLAIGPVGSPVVHTGPADPASVALVEAAHDGLEAREDAAVRSRIAEAVVVHDIKGRRTRKGADDYLEVMKSTLGEEGHLMRLKTHAAGNWVIVEGAVYGVETDADGNAREHGLVDVHRLEGGAIAETWHYLNRRGRPHRSRAVVAPKP